MNVLLWVVLPLSIATGLYAVLAAGYFFALGRPGMALGFVGYCIANAGFILDAMGWKI